jgi:hypothetical protein
MTHTKYLSPLFLTFYCTVTDLDVESIRSPGPVSPQDAECEGFDLTYPRIASSSNSITAPQPSLDYDVDKKVNESIQSFLMTLSQIGPELLSVSWERETANGYGTIVLCCLLSLLTIFVSFQGSLTLSFFERRKTQQLFGLVSNEERVV